MKVILAGASGYIATEILQQSLQHPGITTLVALARRHISAPSSTSPEDAAKLRSVRIEDYPAAPEGYPEDVKKEFAGADRTVGITPLRSTTYNWEDVCRVNSACPQAALKAMQAASPARPFRFVMMSGSGVERDQEKSLIFKPVYMKMRGATETAMLESAATAQPPGSLEVIIPKPGLVIRAGIFSIIPRAVTAALPGLGTVGLAECAAAIVDAAVNGSEKDTLENEDLARIGRRLLVG